MKKKMLIVAAVIFSSRLLAQQDTSKVLDPVIVTANKIPQKQSSTGKVLIVIGREQLEKNTGRLLTQVLNEQAGLLINGAQSAFGTNQTVYMRGANAANTLILVDGVPVNDAAGISNEFDLNYFSIDLIERVEVLKGSQSVMYGSGATAGVINIITRKTLDNKKISFNGTTSFGSYHTFKSSLGVSGNIKKFNYNVAYNKLSSEGFSSALDTLGNQQFDNEPYDQDILLLNTSFQASKNWQLRFYSQYAKYDAKLDDASFTDDKNSVVTNKNFQSTLSSVIKFSKGTFNVNANYNHVDRLLNDERNVPEDLNDYDPYNAHYR